MARNSETVAAAIEAVNAIISEQNAALKALKDTLAQKAAGSGGADLTDVEVFIGDLADSTTYTITKGAVDGYKRTIIS